MLFGKKGGLQMPEKKQKPKKGPVEVERVFEQPQQPPDSISFYCELGQVFTTKNEIVLQFYETIPGVPGLKGNIEKVKTRLRATITLSYPHAATIGKLLTKRTKKKAEETKKSKK